MRLIDAEYIKAVMLNDRLMQGNAEFTLYAQQVETQVNALPSIEIIRCRECKHNYNTAINHGKMQPRCDFTDWKLTENDFCSRGERKVSEKPTGSEKPNNSEIPTDSERSSE